MKLEFKDGTIHQVMADGTHVKLVDKFGKRISPSKLTQMIMKHGVYKGERNGQGN